jgi:hypothetical protein
MGGLDDEKISTVHERGEMGRFYLLYDVQDFLGQPTVGDWPFGISV